MKQITTSNFSFESLRRDDVLYVDKTQYVWSLVNSKENIYFFSRPRRFGKSLLLSTLEAFFLNKRELFKGLAIDSLAPDEVWKEWPVIHLDMSQASSFDGYEEQKRAFTNYISSVIRRMGLTPIDGEMPKDMFRRLISYLKETTGNNVVVLIDEYDKPILDALHSDYVGKTVGMMQSFYQELKSNVPQERFVFITGVSKFSHTSLFSGVNNLTDITQDTEFSAMLGYTEQELRDNFAEHIDYTAQALKTDRESLISKMKRWYDGFRFTSEATQVFNPVSVGKFFRNRAFLNYWFSTGTPTFLVKQMRNNPFMLEDFTHDFVEPMTFDSFEVNTIDPMGLAVQTGYLTIKDVCEDEIGISYRYDFPNEEIRMSWNRDMVKYITSGNVQIDRISRRFLLPFSQGNIDTVMQLLKSLFAGVTKENLGAVHEGYYRNMMYMLFTAFGIDCHSEEQVAGGRVDMVAKAYDKAYIFELKVSQSGTEQDIVKCLEQGIDQATRNHYADKYHFDANSVYVVSVAFENINHQLVAWKEQKN